MEARRKFDAQFKEGAVRSYQDQIPTNKSLRLQGIAFLLGVAQPVEA